MLFSLSSSILLPLLFLSVIVDPISAAKCSVRSGDISARWQTVDGELTVEVITKNLGNNEWSGIGFGPDMSNLELVLFEVVNNSPKIETGFSKGYGPPHIDSTRNVNLQSLNYNSNTLIARFSRPIASNGARSHSLATCSTWNFFAAASLDQNSAPIISEPLIRITDVCPVECVQIFTNRNIFNDPIPENAIFNNRISTRFDNLFQNDTKK